MEDEERDQVTEESLLRLHILEAVLADEELGTPTEAEVATTTSPGAQLIKW